MLAQHERPHIDDPEHEPGRGDRLVRNFTRIGLSNAERVEPLNCGVVLSPEEAARGVSNFRLRILIHIDR